MCSNRLLQTLCAAWLGIFWSVTATAQTAPTIEPQRSWAHSQSDSVPYDRGLLTVPLVRSDPSSRLIQIEVHRFPATRGADPQTPPVVLLHGGPGWPGLGASLGSPAYVENTIKPYVRVADLIVVGQRGIGSSPPNTTCPAAPLRGTVRDGSTRDEEHDLMRQASAACKASWEERGYDLQGFNVIEAASDVDDARRALGYDRIIVWGVSFGSHWGMAVMRFHPDIVTRAVLSGLEGPDHTYDSPTGVLDALRRIAAAAEADERLSALIPDAGLVEGFRATIQQADNEPIVVAIPDTGEEVVIRGDDIRRAALGYTARAASRNGARTWPGDLIRLIRGDWSQLATSIARIRRTARQLPTASFWMLDCGSGITPERHARYHADPAQEIVGDLSEFYDVNCPVWQSDLGDEFRQYFDTQIPTLLVHGDWDTSTPLVNAMELAPHFANSKLVIVEGGSHGVLREVMTANADMRDRIWRFVATGSLEGFPDRVVLPDLDWVVPSGH